MKIKILTLSMVFLLGLTLPMCATDSNAESPYGEETNSFQFPFPFPSPDTSSNSFPFPFPFPDPDPDPEPSPDPDPDPEPSPDPDPEPSPDPDPDPIDNDDVESEVTSEGTIRVLKGTYDGGGESFGGVGDGSQSEDQPPVFELEPGTNLINCKIVPPAGDGIHVHGDNTIENVEFVDVGEDAISMRSNFEGGTVTIRNCSFSKASDKVFQVNRESTWYLYDITVNTAGKVLRQNGGKTFKLDVYIDGLEAYDIDEAIVRSDSPDCTVYYENITTDLPSDKWWKGELTAVPR
jgi:hypothetical protein